MTDAETEVVVPAVQAPPSRRPARPGVFRFSVVYFLVALIVLFVTAPYVEMIRGGSLIAVVLISLVLLLAVLAIGARKRTLIGATLLALPSLAERWYSLHGHHPVADALSIAGALLLVLLVIFKLMRFILRAPQVNSEVVCGGIAVYLLIGLVYACGYMMASDLRPGSFAQNGVVLTKEQSLDGIDAVYFSFVTLSTVGYGDITPASKPMKMAAAGEAIIGAFYMTILIARLVSLYSSSPKQERSA